MIRKELSVEDIKNLKDNSQVYIVYLDGTEFDLEYCATVPINTYSDYRFVDSEGDEFSIEEVIVYINDGSIKVYSTENTQFKTERKLTNYERIKSMTIEEMAKFFNNEIDDIECSCRCKYYNIGQPKCDYRCTKGYTEWLMQEVE